MEEQVYAGAEPDSSVPSVLADAERQAHPGLGEAVLGSCPYGQLLARRQALGCSQSHEQLMAEGTGHVLPHGRLGSG